MPRLETVLPRAAYVALAIADSVAAGRGGSASGRLRYVLKPALMPALTLAFLHGTRREDAAPDAGRPGTSRSERELLRAGTTVAQAFSWGGDVALLGRSRSSFLTGVGSFFAAHVAYVATFLSLRGEVEERDTAGLRTALGAWLVLTPLMSVAAGRKDPTLRGPVAAYATILVGMVASSRTLDPAVPRAARRRLRAGTALFLVSDTVLAAQRFLLPTPRPVLGSVVMATYTAGQGLIAAGAAGAVDSRTAAV